MGGVVGAPPLIPIPIPPIPIPRFTLEFDMEPRIPLLPPPAAIEPETEPLADFAGLPLNPADWRLGPAAPLCPCAEIFLGLFASCALVNLCPVLPNAVGCFPFPLPLPPNPLISPPAAFPPRAEVLAGGVSNPLKKLWFPGELLRDGVLEFDPAPPSTSTALPFRQFPHAAANGPTA